MADWILPLFLGGFEAIAKEGKTVEGRAPDPTKPEKDYDKIKKGDRVIFRAISDQDFKPLGKGDMTFPVEYNHKYHERNAQLSVFKMLQREGLEKLLPGCTSIAEGIEIYMNLPGYSERIQRYGIHAIGLGKRIS